MNDYTVWYKIKALINRVFSIHKRKNHMNAPDLLPDKLFDFAYFPRLEGDISFLAENLAVKEIWKYPNINSFLSEEKTAGSYKEYPILTNYIFNTYIRIAQETNRIISEDKEKCCWNTGLLSISREPIYATFVKNDGTGTQYWKFYKFLSKSDRYLSGFGKVLPDMCNYAKNPSDLVFDQSKEIVPDFNHILNDHPERYSKDFSKLSERARMNILRGAIDDAKEITKRTQKNAVPQYYKGSIQLLLPLYLMCDSPELAIVLETANDFIYRAGTVLPLDWAYSNARVITKPNSDWLEPDLSKLGT